MEQNGSRSTKQILADTLLTLEARRERLAAFVEEHAEVARAIAVIEKAAGAGKSNSKGANPRAAFAEKVLHAVSTSADPLSLEQLQEATKARSADWLRALLDRMVGAGQLVSVEGGYGKPVVAVAEME